MCTRHTITGCGQSIEGMLAPYRSLAVHWCVSHFRDSRGCDQLFIMSRLCWSPSAPCSWLCRLCRPSCSPIAHAAVCRRLEDLKLGFGFYIYIAWWHADINLQIHLHRSLQRAYCDSNWWNAISRSSFGGIWSVWRPELAKRGRGILVKLVFCIIYSITDLN